MTSNKIDISYQKGQHVGKYLIVDVLDQQSDLYLAQQPDDDRQVMIEVLRPPLLDDLKQPFLARTQKLMTLQHPHILRLQEAGIDDNHYPFLVTDHLSHFTLRELYPEITTAPLNRILFNLKQIAAALHYAHKHNVLHRDIRPENILLYKNNQSVLWRFTIDAITENRERLHHQADHMLNSIAYAAPEQIQGTPGPASDQYSLAVVVYELLSGALPFSGSYIEIANQQLHTPPPSLLQNSPDLSPGVESVIMKALAKQPKQRFPSVIAFVSALEDAQQDLSEAPTVARTPSLQSGEAASPLVESQSATLPDPPENFSPANIPPVPTLYADASAPPLTPVDTSAEETQPVASPPAAATYGQHHVSSRSLADMPTLAESPLAPRPGSNATMTRRAFAAGLVLLAAAGGAGGWYILSKRLAKAAPPTVSANGLPPATPVSVNQKPALIFAGHLAGVNAVAWSPDGKLLVSAGDDSYVQVFDANTGRRKVVYAGHTAEVAAVAWSPDGKTIASSGQDGTVQLWNAANGRKSFTYKGHHSRVNAVSWSSDSQAIASGGDDKTVQVWSVSSGDVAFNFRGHAGGVLCVAWQPDGSSVASGSWDGTLRDWATVQHGNHFNAGEQVFSYDGHGKSEVYAVAWSPDGSFIVSAGADQTVQISNGIDGTPRPPFFTGHQSKQQGNSVRAVAWSPNGDYIASGDLNGNVYVWRTAGRKTVFTYRGHKGAVNAVAWSPNGKFIASASADNTVHVWQPF